MTPVLICAPCRKKLTDAGWGTIERQAVCEYCGVERACVPVSFAKPLPTAQPPLTPNTPDV